MLLNSEYRESAESRSSSVQEGCDELDDKAALAEPDFSELLPVSQWTVENVADWVRAIPFPRSESARYAQLFIDNAVHGPLLLQLNQELLEDIGIERKIHLRRILTDLDNLKRNETLADFEPDPLPQTDISLLANNYLDEHILPLSQQIKAVTDNQHRLMSAISELQERFETMPYWNRVRMVEKLGLADTESISRHFEDLEDGAMYYPSIYVDCERKEHIIIGHYTCYGKLYGKPFYVKNCKTKKLLLYYRSDLDKKRWRFTRTNKHSLADFCEKRKYQARTKDSCDFPAAHFIPIETEWAVWDGRTDHNWRVRIEISDHQPYLDHWIRKTYYGRILNSSLCDLCASFIFVPEEELYNNRRLDDLDKIAE